MARTSPNDPSTGAAGRVEGSNAVGTNASANEWHFPEGASGAQFDTFLLLGNVDVPAVDGLDHSLRRRDRPLHSVAAPADRDGRGPPDDPHEHVSRPGRGLGRAAAWHAAGQVVRLQGHGRRRRARSSPKRPSTGSGTARNYWRSGSAWFGIPDSWPVRARAGWTGHSRPVRVQPYGPGVRPAHSLDADFIGLCARRDPRGRHGRHRRVTDRRTARGDDRRGPPRSRRPAGARSGPRGGGALPRRTGCSDGPPDTRPPLHSRSRRCCPSIRARRRSMPTTRGSRRPSAKTCQWCAVSRERRSSPLARQNSRASGSMPSRRWRGRGEPMPARGSTAQLPRLRPDGRAVAGLRSPGRIWETRRLRDASCRRPRNRPAAEGLKPSRRFHLPECAGPSRSCARRWRPGPEPPGRGCECCCRARLEDARTRARTGREGGRSVREIRSGASRSPSSEARGAKRSVEAGLTSPAPDARLLAASALKARGRTGWPDVVRPLLQNPDGLVRFQAAELLLSVERKPALDVLIAGTTDTNLAVRGEVARILAADKLLEVAQFRRLLRDGAPGVRLEAARALLSRTSPATAPQR